MTILETGTGLDLFLIRNYFDAYVCQRLLAEMRAAQSAPATIYRDVASGVIDQRMRKATRVEPSGETDAFVRRMLLERKQAVEEDFRVSVSDCEDPQFLRYGVGDFFVAHQDGNTGLIRSEREMSRKMSVVIFLSNQSENPEPDTCCGGSLLLHPLGCRLGPRR